MKKEMKKNNTIFVNLPFDVEERKWDETIIQHMRNEFVRELACHLALVSANRDDSGFVDTIVSAFFGISAFMVNCEFIEQSQADLYRADFLRHVENILESEED